LRWCTCAIAENDFEIELTLNKGRTEAYTHGSGYGHIGVVVDDATSVHKTLSAAGYEPAQVKEFKDGEKLLARFFFFIQIPTATRSKCWNGTGISVAEFHWRVIPSEAGAAARDLSAQTTEILAAARNDTAFECLLACGSE